MIRLLKGLAVGGLLVASASCAMAQSRVTIDTLPLATLPLTGAEVVPAMQGGLTVKIPVSSLGGSGGTPGNPTATIGATAVNGTSLLYMRADAAPPLPSTLPALNGSLLTNLTSGNLVGALPAISGAALTALTPANLSAAVPVNKGGTNCTVAAIGCVTAISGATGSPSGTTYLRGDGTWSTPPGTGTVTSAGASFTGGIISIAGSPVTGAGTLAFTIAGTSGGIPYFSSSSAWATSAALTANLPMIGGGAGAAPAVGTRSGNTTGYMNFTGSFVNGNVVLTDINHNAVDGGYAPGPQGIGAFITAGLSPSMIDFNVGCKQITVNGAAQTISLPALSSPQGGGCYIISTPFNQTVTVAPNGTDKINGVNASVTVAANFNSIVTADAVTPANGWGVPIGPSGGSGVPSIAGTANQVNQSGSPGATTLSLSSTIVLPGTLSDPTNGAASTAAMKLTGSPYTLGNGSTAHGLLQLRASSGVTSPTALNTSGVLVELTPPDAFAGSLIQAFVGNAQVFNLTYQGAIGAHGLSLDNTGSLVTWNNSLNISANSTNNMLIQDNTGTDMGSVLWGGTTSSYPGLKRSTTGLVFRLADDSANTWMQASYGILGGTTVAGLPTGVQGARAFITDGTACTLGTTAVGGGAVKCPVYYDGAAWKEGG